MNITIVVTLCTFVFGNLIAVWQGLYKKKASVSWLALFGVAVLAYELIIATPSWWASIVLLWILYQESGPRTYAVLSENHKLDRLYYFLCCDVPVIAITIFVGLNVHNFWLLSIYSLAIFGWQFIFSFPAQTFFPVVAREERRRYYRFIKDVAKTNKLNAEILELEHQALVKKTLGQVAKQKGMISQALAAIDENRADQALKYLNSVIDELEEVRADLLPQQTTILGHAHLLRARTQVKLQKLDLADADLNKAYKLVHVDLGSLSELVEAFLAGQDFNASLFNHCLQYLTLRKGKEAGSLQKKVWKALKEYLAVVPGLPSKTYKSIIENCKAIIQIDAQLWWAHASLGQAAFLEGNYQQALASLETAVGLFSKDVMAWAYLGKTYQKLNRPADARRAYQSSLSLDERQPEIAHELGLLLLDASTVAKDTGPGSAFYWLELAARLSPKNAVFQYDLARVAKSAGKLKITKEKVLLALQLDEKLLPAHLLAGDLFYEADLWLVALPHYEIIERTTLVNDTIRLRLGRCYAENSQWDEAIIALEPFIGREKLISYPLGRAYLGKNEINKAVDYLRQAVTDNENDLRAWYAFGCALAWQGRGKITKTLQEARRCFERVVKSQPSLAARAQLQLGHIAMRKKNPEEAVEQYLSAYQSPKIKKEAGLALVKAYLARNDIEKAGEILQALEETTRNDPDARYIYGLVAELQKDYPKAISEYQAAGKHGPLGVVLCLSGQFEQAKQALSLARSKGDQSDRVLYYSGLVHSQMGEHYEAINEWQELQARHKDDSRLGDNIARSWYLAGCIEYRKNDYQKAAAAWEQFYELQSSDEDTREKLQSLYVMMAVEALGKPEAASALARAQQLGASKEIIHCINGLEAFTRKNWKDALEAFREIASMAPKNPVYLFNLGLAQLFDQAFDEAEQSFKGALACDGNAYHEQTIWGLAAVAAHNGNWSRVAELTSDAI